MSARLCCVLLACLAASACKQDPAQSVKIIERPPASDTAATPAPVQPDVPVSERTPTLTPPVNPIQTTPTPAAAPSSQDSNRDSNVASSWRPEFCPPPAENADGPGNLTVTGPCAFQHQAAASCQPLHDDFYVALIRKAQKGASLVLYLNVENYRGPGEYDGTQMFVAVQSENTIYRWSNDNAHVTVGPHEAFVSFPATRLAGEPTLIDCTRLIGPATNYQYQCSGRANASMPIDATAEIVSGNLQCTKGTGLAPH